MAKGGNEKNGRSSANQTNPEAEERKRLRKLAISKNLLSEFPAKASSLSLNPSKTVIKHHGRDILRKSNRKNRFLFSFPGLLAPVSGGKVGELKDLGSKNPILYLDFPQGRMKLFGTIVYPKNRYLTLQFSKGGKNVMCEDYFDTMIVFSDAWWIGSKEANPEEIQLSFPEDMNMEQQNEYDFKGGAGSTCERMQGVDQIRAHEPDHEFSDSENDPNDLIQTTATRHSSRISGKSLKAAVSSSADDAFDLDVKTKSSDGEENEIGGSTISGGKDAIETEVTKVSEQLSEISTSAIKLKEVSHSNHGSLVQATISTLFKKKEEKMAINTSTPPTSSKVSRKRLQEPRSEEKVDQSKVSGARQKGKALEERKIATRSTPRKKQPKVSDDEIEDISDPSQDSSDEEWGA
ncbi:DNA-binding protein RHL1 [Cynara cardunculus var. scolymus]|uniref:DNA-binding protein RHL1 n=1 Tax=Cynara cardunculus var. scolymus TaxID=59895 RepID=UPI000D623C0D|nr:DNA-binding protein RHL1 [Cynara cardunculus var. scolymus]